MRGDTLVCSEDGRTDASILALVFRVGCWVGASRVEPPVLAARSVSMAATSGVVVSLSRSGVWLGS